MCVSGYLDGRTEPPCFEPDESTQTIPLIGREYHALKQIFRTPPVFFVRTFIFTCTYLHLVVGPHLVISMLHPVSGDSESGINLPLAYHFFPLIPGVAFPQGRPGSCDGGAHRTFLHGNRGVGSGVEGWRNVERQGSGEGLLCKNAAPRVEPVEVLQGPA